MFRDWYGNVIRRYAYFVEHGHSYDKKEKKYRWLGKDHPYRGGKTKSKEEGKKGGKSQEEEEETDNEMPPLGPIPGAQQNDDEEEEEDSEEDEYDSDAHLWNAGQPSSSWQQSTWNNSSSSWEDPQWLEWYSQEQCQDVDDWWNTNKVVEKMSKMVKAKSSFTGSM